MRRYSFREKGLRHGESHCNFSVRAWRGERMGKKTLDLACVSYIHLGSPLDRCFERVLKVQGA